MNPENKKKQKGPIHRFKKGVSGNPGGRPKSNLLTLLRDYGLKEHKPGETKEAAFARVLWEKSIKGNHNFAKLLIDRILGKISDNLEVKSDGEKLTISLVRYDDSDTA